MDTDISSKTWNLIYCAEVNISKVFNAIMALLKLLVLINGWI